MEALRQEIESELSHVRIKKAHVYEMLTKILNIIDPSSAPKEPAPAPAPAPTPAPAAPEEESAPVKKVKGTTKAKAKPVTKATTEA